MLLGSLAEYFTPLNWNELKWIEFNWIELNWINWYPSHPLGFCLCLIFKLGPLPEGFRVLHFIFRTETTNVLLWIGWICYSSWPLMLLLSLRYFGLYHWKSGISNPYASPIFLYAIQALWLCFSGCVPHLSSYILLLLNMLWGTFAQLLKKLLEPN